MAPLAVGSDLWHEWQERAGVLEDSGVPRDAAEFQAADGLGLLVQQAGVADD
jgi:hypothetical protein